jgi:hypothetical protein
MAVQYIVNNIPGEIDFHIDGDREGRIVQNVKNLLLTRMGEIPYDRQRGFDQNLYDLPINEFRDILMEELDRVLLWEPGAEAVSAEILRTDETRVYFAVTIEIPDEGG